VEEVLVQEVKEDKEEQALADSQEGLDKDDLSTIMMITTTIPHMRKTTTATTMRTTT
jgi:hypothetical protein